MNDIFNRNRGLEFEENDNLCVDRIASAAEKVLESAMDTSADREAIEELTATEGFRLELTATEGFRLKLETIEQAEDMSTQEKLDAISEAEDKLAADKERSAKLHMWLIAKKAGIALSIFAGILLLSASPVGQKTIKGIEGVFSSKI